MKITTTGSLGNVAQPLIKQLIEAGHQVTVITTKYDKASDIEALGAKAAVGSISDASFLTRAFSGADAVYTMMPPSIGTSNFIQNIADAGQAYADAIQAAGINRVVLLSSVGADTESGNGPIQGVHRVENTFSQLNGVDVTVIRSGFFYVNFLRDIPQIKSRNVFGNNFSGDIRLALTHSDDLALAIAEALQGKGDGFEVKYVVSDVSTGNQLAALFGKAIGQPELTWTAIPDEQLKQGMLSAGMSAELVGLIVEMGQGVQRGLIMNDYFSTDGNVTGKVKLEQFAEEFKSRYTQA